MSHVEIVLRDETLPAHGRWARGAAVWNGRFLRGADIMAALPATDASLDEWAWALRALNGFYAIVDTAGGRVVAAVDRLRSIPLFYAHVDGRFLLSDSAEWIRSRLALTQFDATAEEEFTRAGYVTGRRTLFADIHQLQAGELIVYDAGAKRPETTRYYVLTTSRNEKPVAREEAARALNESVDGSIRRLIDYADGRQIVVPLSGGYDSRLVALKLKELAYPRVLTFTYGTPGSAEAKVSRSVAESLGLPWHIVLHSQDLWRQAWQAPERLHYQRFASNWASVPHHQDWLAVRAMRADGTIEADAVFAPGHTGDFIAGGHLGGVVARSRGRFSKVRLAESIVDKHLSLAPWTGSDRREWVARLAEELAVPALLSASKMASAYEAWEWQERQAKFIVNSVRVYEYFGYDWWLPLWDADLMAFFESLPLDLRLGKGLYDQYVVERYQAVSGTTTEIYGARSHETPLRSRIARALMPRILKARLRGRPRRLPYGDDGFGALGRYDQGVVERLLRDGYTPNGITVMHFLLDAEYSEGAGPEGFTTSSRYAVGRQ